MQTKITSKIVVAFILYTALVVSITCAVTTKMLSKDNVEETSVVNTDSIEASSEPTEDVEIVEEDSDVVTADLILSDGTKYTYNIPEGHNCITANYIDNVVQAYNAKPDIFSDNIIVTGDGDSIYNSVESVSATTISSLKSLMRSLYGDDINVDDLAYSEAYTYMKTGEVPETNLIDYSIEEVDTIKVGDVTYKAYYVSYYIDAEGTGNKDDYIKNEQLMCYSDTEDVIEIIVYANSNVKERTLELLHDFLGV